MNANVDPVEARALRESLARVNAPADPAAVSPAQVAARDFARPRRLAPAERDRLIGLLAKQAEKLQAVLCAQLRASFPLRLATVEEVPADDALASRPLPWAALQFEVSGQPGWIVWDNPGALAALELLLGNPEPELGDPRPLSSVERGLLESGLSEFAKHLAESLGLSFERLRCVARPEDAGSWRDGGEQGDWQRLLIAFDFEGPGGPSVLRVFVPGVAPSRTRSARGAAPADLPAHLSEVAVDLRARLVSEVPLDQLLALEVGDVIPMASPGGKSVCLLVEDQETAIATLGRSSNKLAVRIERVIPNAIELDVTAARPAPSAKGGKHG
jgi:flagellar motor switch protein FliM